MYAIEFNHANRIGIYSTYEFHNFWGYFSDKMLNMNKMQKFKMSRNTKTLVGTL